MAGTPLTDAIEALTTYSNTVTGASDTTLSEAVATLAAGYGGGGIDLNDVASGALSGAIVLDTATDIQEQRFKGMTNITSVTAPYVTTLREQIFRSCTSLQSISFAGAGSVNSSQQFLGCTALTNVNLPSLNVPGGNMFQGCTSLAFVDFPSLTRMNVSRVFYGCNALQTIVLRYTDGVVSLNNDVFANTPFAGYNGLTGTCYVPSALISSYKTANNWSTLYNNGTCTFVAIEGSIYE